MFYSLQRHVVYYHKALLYLLCPLNIKQLLLLVKSQSLSLM